MALLYVSVHAMAQRNRYGMTIIKQQSGDCGIDRQAEFEKLIDLTTLTDLCTPYKYAAEKITHQDYNGCKTSSFVYKDYGAYQLKMEVDIPTHSNGPYPFIIYVHGGGWANGSLNGFANQSKFLATRGIAGVRISYSLKKQQGHFDMGMEELEAAYQFVKLHAQEWNLDLTRLGYAGGSAGAPLASLATVKNKNCKLFIGANGIYDFTYTAHTGSFPSGSNSYLKNHQSGDKLKEISAMHHIPKENPPAVALFHGTADVTIPYQQSLLFYDAVTKKGGLAEKHIFPNYSHTFYNKDVSDKYEDITIAMYNFANKIFNK